MNRRQPLTRKSQLRPRSKKRAELYRKERVPLVKALLAERPICQRCQASPSVDIHELRSRARGGSILDLDNLAALCRPCHEWITTNPARAQAEGWALPSWPAKARPPGGS